MNPKTNIKPQVFVVDDDVELSQSLKWLLESMSLEVSTYNNGLDFLNAFQPRNTGCILLDIRMPMMSGLELQEQLNNRLNTLPIIFMTGHGDVPMAVRAMKAGAFDFLTKPFSDQMMLDQIQRAIAFHQQLTLKNQYQANTESLFETLTKREQEIFKLVATGKLNKEIAYEMQISMKTVELHRSHVMQKMQVTKVTELVKHYLILKESEKMKV